MANNPITIGILTYKRPDYLKVALESALKQETAPAEILIIDDGSGPETRELVKPYAEKHSHIRYVWQENGGHSPARNRAVAECKTDYLMWLDDDDAFTPDAVSSQLKVLQENPDADIIYANLTLCDKNLNPVEPMPSHVFNEHNLLYKFFKHNPVPNPGTLTSMDCFRRVGVYDDVYRYAEDYDFHARAASLRVKFVHNNTAIVFYRSHPKNLATRTNALKADHERSAIVQSFLGREKFEEVFYQQPWDIDPEKALFGSCLEAMTLFARLDDYPAARSMLEKVNTPGFLPMAELLRAILDSFEADGVAGIRFYAEHPLFNAGPTERLIDTLLERTVEPEEMDCIRSEIAVERLEREGLSRIYPHLPWQENADVALTAASVEYSTKLARFGDYESAYNQLSKVNSPECEIVTNFISEMIRQFDSGGVAALEGFKGNPVFESPMAKQLYGVLKEREERYEIIERERALSYACSKEGSITIAIITKDREEYLKVAIESALKQTSAADEILVIDDGSGPKTRAIVEEVAKTHDCIRYIRKEAEGRPAARNKVVSELKTDYLIWLDDDDYLFPHTVEEYRAAISENPGIDIVYGHLILCDEDLKPTEEQRKHSIEEESRIYQFFKCSAVPNGGTLIRKACLEEIGGYRNEFVRGQDYDFFARAASASRSFLLRDFNSCYYRSHSGNCATTLALNNSSQYRAAVVKGILERHTLEEIFPHLPWTEAPSVAQLTACHEVALVFCRCKEFHSAVDIFAHVIDPSLGILVNLFQEIIRDFNASGVAGFERHKTETLFYTVLTEQLVSVLLDLELDRVEKNQYVASFLKFRMENIPNEDIYANLDWVGNRAHAEFMALYDTAQRLAVVEEYDAARSVLRSSEFSEVNTLLQPLCEAVTSLEKEGVDGLDEILNAGHPADSELLSFAEVLKETLFEQSVLPAGIQQPLSEDKKTFNPRSPLALL